MPKVRTITGAVAAAGLLCGLVAAALMATAGPGPATDKVVTETISAADLAAAVEELNQEYFLDGADEAGKEPAAVVGRLGTAVNARASSRDSLAREAEKVEAMDRRLKIDGRVTVTGVAVSVHSEHREGEVRFVELDVKRTLKNGPRWEELAPFAIVDRTSDDGKLVAGQIIALDRDAVEAGQVPESLLRSDRSR